MKFEGCCQSDISIPCGAYIGTEDGGTEGAYARVGSTVDAVCSGLCDAICCVAQFCMYDGADIDVCIEYVGCGTQDGIEYKEQGGGSNECEIDAVVVGDITKASFVMVISLLTNGVDLC